MFSSSYFFNISLKYGLENLFFIFHNKIMIRNKILIFYFCFLFITCYFTSRLGWFKENRKFDNLTLKWKFIALLFFMFFWVQNWISFFLFFFLFCFFCLAKRFHSFILLFSIYMTFCCFLCLFFSFSFLFYMNLTKSSLSE